MTVSPTLINEVHFKIVNLDVLRPIQKSDANMSIKLTLRTFHAPSKYRFQPRMQTKRASTNNLGAFEFMKAVYQHMV